MNKTPTLHELFDGVTMTFRGIHGTFVHTPAHVSPNGMFYIGSALMFEPSTKGKRSEKYQQAKREMRDDWSWDVSQDDEELIAIAIRRKMV